MASPPHNQNCPTDTRYPRPVSFCDRCNHEYYLDDLPYQYDWRGASLQNLHLRVCERCLDIPNDQLRPIIIGPDPVPLVDPRPGFWPQEEAAGSPPPGTSTLGWGQGGWSLGPYSVGANPPDFIED